MKLFILQSPEVRAERGFGLGHAALNQTVGYLRTRIATRAYNIHQEIIMYL